MDLVGLKEGHSGDLKSKDPKMGFIGDVNISFGFQKYKIHIYLDNGLTNIQMVSIVFQFMGYSWFGFRAMA